MPDLQWLLRGTYLTHLAAAPARTMVVATATIVLAVHLRGRGQSPAGRALQRPSPRFDFQLHRTRTSFSESCQQTTQTSLETGPLPPVRPWPYPPVLAAVLQDRLVFYRWRYLASFHRYCAGDRQPGATSHLHLPSGPIRPCLRHYHPPAGQRLLARDLLDPCLCPCQNQPPEAAERVHRPVYLP